MRDNSNKKPKPPQKAAIDKIVGNIQRRKEEELTQKLADDIKLEYRDLVGSQPNPAAVGIIPKDLAHSANIFAFEKEGNKILLAMSEPKSAETQAALKQLTDTSKQGFKPILVSKSSMRYLLAAYDTFAPSESQGAIIEISQKEKAQFSKVTSLKDFKSKIADVSTSDALETIFAGATGLDASDIHIEPTKQDVRLRYRLDGVLHDVAVLPSNLLDAIINRIKLMSKLKLNIKKTAQDGRFSISAGKTNYDIRVSILPSQYGESAVLRLLPQEGRFVALDELGLSPKAKAIVDAAIHQPNGLILNTGPTGSGKTTTLYAILNTINSPTTKIITVEDPIEYRLKGTTQTQVSKEEDYNFANALRSIVRQDPDVILVGEIRDNDTADIAVDASLTGHLVLSTLHTNDASGAIPRLIELGAEPNLFADALRLIIAQRLVRKVCPKCREAHQPTDAEIQKIKKINLDATIPDQLYGATGCEECNGTGYKGRIGIFELFEITPELKNKIAAGVSSHEIRELALKQNMTTLLQDGLDKVLAGITTLEELDRVVE